MKQGFDYYRIKTEWLSEKDTGDLQKRKTEELVLASSYAEAEKIAYAIAEDQQRSRFSDIKPEILRTKIDDILYNDALVHEEGTLIGGLVENYFTESEDTGMGLYAVKVMFIDIDEKTAKEKRTNETIYVPAKTNIDAANFVENYLKPTGRDFTIRDTKFDKAEAIFWPTDVQESKMNTN